MVVGQERGPLVPVHPTNRDQKWLLERQTVLDSVTQHLHRAHQRMKAQVDKHRTERVFDVGELVFLKLQPYVQSSVVRRANHKLSFKYFGPYKILDKIGEVAYKLELPATSKIHPVFHVSQLKKVPVQVLQSRVRQVGQKTVAQGLILWSGSSPDEATWEDLESPRQQFPRAAAWGQAISQRRGNVSEPLSTQIFQQAVKITSAKKGCANFSLSIEHNLAHVIPSLPINLEKIPNPLTRIIVEEKMIPIFPGMITYALAQLGGASARSAIAGFIAARFTGLPVSHDALLSAHLRRLVAEGVLCTSGFSYLFSSHHQPPESNSPDLDSDDQSGSGFHFHLHSSSDDDDDDDDAYTPLLHLPVPVPVPVPVLGEKRGRGRPRNSSPANAAGRPRKAAAATPGEPCPAPAKGEPTEHSGAGLGSVLLSGKPKRGRGRPRKLQRVGPSPSTGGGGGGGRIKRGPGRPTKEDQQSQAAAAKHPPTPTASSTGGIAKIKRGPGRPRKEEQQSQAAAAAAQHPPTPTASSTGGIAKIKRGPGRPRKEEQQSQAAAAQHPPTPTASSTGGIIKIKRGRGRPRKEEEQQSQEATMPLPTPPASRGFKVGCGRPMLAPTSHLETHGGPPRNRRPIIIEKLPPAARWSVDAMPSEIKRPRIYRPSAETGDATPAPETVDAASSGIKIEGVQPQVDKPTAPMPAEAGDARSAGIKRGRGRPRKDKPAAAAAAMLAQTEAVDAVSTGMKGALENPISGYVVSTGTKGALEKPSSAGDIVSVVMKRGRGRPRKEQLAFD
ncbi:hypothetical protein TRIUR3_30242 [Triticum urartu]|uniref:Uncharacterized protein n=1 Tax=Triticum urartu TaxID=4572 RepID=M7Z259_TRIUA|nr:hypothetical protein TRIUR3_30242 [Triticum urartu]